MENRKDGETGRVYRPVGVIRTDFPTKFGIPRQSGLLENALSEVELFPDYASPDVFRSLDGFSHVWLLWDFSEVPEGKWQPTVRPPRLGGNTHVGVFASRSPYRPNPIGLSCVRLVKILPEEGKLIVAGADMMSGTPVLDIKPYVPYTDCIPGAKGGFAEEKKENRMRVEADPELLKRLPDEKRATLLKILEEDPRPAYHDDPDRVYGFPFAGMEVRFRADDRSGTVFLTGLTDMETDG